MSARILPYPGSGPVFTGKSRTRWFFGGRGALPVPVMGRPGFRARGDRNRTSAKPQVTIFDGLASRGCSPLRSDYRRCGAVSGTSSTEEGVDGRNSCEGEEGERAEGSGSGSDGKPGVQRYLLAVEYIGTRFSGSQWQPDRRTVVGVLQDAFLQFIGRPVTVVCSSRTDSGVHALSNVCHADVERISKRKPGEVLTPYDSRIVKRAVNHFLKKNEGDIRIIEAASVSGDFHARFNAQERVYFYRLLSGPGPLSLFERGRAWQVPEDLDVLAMKKACSVLVGCHDFSSFRGARCQARSPLKTLDELDVFEAHPSMLFPSHTRSQLFGQSTKHRCIIIKARARSFLYHQVRLLVGVLKSVGTGDLTVDDVQRILNAKRVTASEPMAPACGLYLGGVKYNLL